MPVTARAQLSALHGQVGATGGVVLVVVVVDFVVQSGLTDFLTVAFGDARAAPAKRRLMITADFIVGGLEKGLLKQKTIGRNEENSD